jgi:hypothetical protein
LLDELRHEAEADAAEKLLRRSLGLQDAV